MQYRRRAWAEIDLDALTHNVKMIQEKLSENTKFCAVVKANAYGHGEEYICRTLSELGIKFYAVSSIEEGIRVRNYCPEGEILLLGYTPPECVNLLIQGNFIQTIVSVEHAKKLSENVPENKQLRCHVKLDTGMGRIGIQANSERCQQELEEISKLKNLTIEGIFTHYAVSDDDSPENIAYTKKQEDLLFRTVEQCAERGILFKHVHCLNSAGICYHPQPKSTLARAGIILYGLKPNANLAVPMDTRPVLSFYSRISHVKMMHSGDCISYGRTYTAKTSTKIATVTVGYADGYSRLLSNRGEVLVHGQRCRITGNICMDQMMIDVSNVPEVSVGDVVTLIGKDGNSCITADNLAELYGTIGYEVVCNISKRIPRIFIQQGKIIHEEELF